MVELSDYLRGYGYKFTGRCACKGHPYRWIHPSGNEVKLYDNGEWKLHRGTQTLRYGKIETAIQELKEWHGEHLAQATH